MDELGSARRETHPWPDAWKKSHWSCWNLSFASAAETLYAASYLSTIYSMIAADSLLRPRAVVVVSTDSRHAHDGGGGATHQMTKSPLA